MLLSWLIDDEEIDESRNKRNWSAFYSVVIHPECFQEIQKRASLLVSISAGVEEWNSSKYGRILGIPDTRTLNLLYQLWQNYSNFPKPDSNEHKISRDRFMKAFHKSQVHDGITLSGLRAAGPNAIHALDSSSHAFRFWKTGVLGGLDELRTNATCVNPLFVFSKFGGEDCVIHYGTDPIYGFHCSTAFVEVYHKADHTTSPQYTDSESSEVTLRRFVKTAMNQFKAWCSAFQVATTSTAHGTPAVQVHHFCGDAMEFCFALQTTMEKIDPQFNIYQSCRAPWKNPLLFPKNSAFVRPFDVIDTSNIVDHIGVINTLICCIPLLKYTSNATLYTEHLVIEATKDLEPLDRLKSLLCGDPSAMFFLFGIAPMECLTGVTTASSYLEELAQTWSGGVRLTQNRWRFSWKHMRLGDQMAASLFTNPIVCTWVAESLATLFVGVYEDMFKDEELSSVMQSLMKASLMAGQYTRASFAALLALAKRLHFVNDWKAFSETVLNNISAASTRSISLKNMSIQELCAQFHLQGVHTVDVMKTSLVASPPNLPSAWSSLRSFPPCLGLLLRVPCEQCQPIIQEFDPNQAKSRISFEIHISCPPHENSYAVLQFTFASYVSGPGIPNAWRTSGDLIFYTQVPCWTILESINMHSKISLRLRMEPVALQRFSATLGSLLIVFEASLNDGNHVLPDVTKEVQKVVSSPKTRPLTIERPECSIQSPSISVANGHVSATVRITFKDDSKTELAAGATVTNAQDSPCVMTVSVGKVAVQFPVPFPFLLPNSTVRIARKSGWIEVVIPFTMNISSSSFNFGEFPVIQKGVAQPFSWNLPRITPRRLPAVNLFTKNDLQWINTNVTASFSVRERTLREQHIKERTTGNPFVDLKEELFSFFMQASGVQSSFKKPQKFLFLETPELGVMCVIFVTQIRLEEDDATVVADAHVLPLTPRLVKDLASELHALNQHGAVTIRCVDASYKLWGLYLAASIERSRDWVHSMHCHRTVSRKSSSIQPFEDLICECGTGKVSDEFKAVKEWKAFRPFVTRCLLTPIFAAPGMEGSIPKSFFNKFQELMGSKGSEEDRNKEGKREVKNEDGCAICKAREGAGGRKLLTCSGCSRANYCSRECQKKDWKEHKKICVKK